MFDTAFFRRWTTAAAARAVDREGGRPTDLDSATGDGGHGDDVRRGFAAVTDALEKEPAGTPGDVLVLAGRQLISTVDGASGPLYGTLLRRTGKALGDAAEVSREQPADAFGAGVAAVAELGGAKAGDKTTLDAPLPAVDALGSSAGAAREAAAGAPATVPLVARTDRAAVLGRRGAGHQDPGAASAALLVEALAEAAGADDGGRA